MTKDGPAQPAGDRSASRVPTGSPGADRPQAEVRPLRLSDPLDETAAEDRPESWGDPSGTDAQRLAAYRSARPPHHGD